ncbi:AraC family transcriptional regulator [Paenibacillus sp. GD4]|uniref:helix-turn-helix domain-containing protein n=1 Tax=Paenibacillus sp. GD4 TaxID=3068890 RepID=UPI002796528A|nr:AraC family transcriptional regulator [Paenibacillus sp. GD4]MDQ1914473.1 AraC family transcriptional regulator [Paenibacillus sp. GD4]
MPGWKGFKGNTPSLFAKLMSSFLVVIVLLAAFNFTSFLYLKSKIHSEIIKYNELNLNSTVVRYENHFRLMREMIIGLSRDDKWMANLNLLRNVKQFNGYDRMESVIADIKLLISNPFMSMDNILLHFRNDGYVLEKEGTSEAERLFTRYYASPAYSADFWKRQFEDPAMFKLLPAAEFVETSAHVEKNKGRLLPAIIKFMPLKDMYFIVMLQPDKMFQSYHYATDTDFTILGEDGTAIYSSRPESSLTTTEAFQGAEGHFSRDQHYYFYKKGQDTGLTYVSVVPIQTISNQLIKLNLIFLTLLVITIALSIVTSLFFTFRLNSPVQMIMDAMQKRGSSLPLQGQIREFDLISEKVSSILKTNDQMTEDLDKKKALLRYYAYTNKLRSIHMNLAELTDMVAADTPFVLVMYQVTFKESFAELDTELEKALYFVREYIASSLLQVFEDPLTFQMEKDTVLSLIFKPDEAEIDQTLEQLRQVFALDRDLLFVTVAVSPVYSTSTELLSAYNSASSMLQQRTLNDLTQIIRTPKAPASTVHFTVLEEEEFHTRFMSGSEESVMEWIHKQLQALYKKEATVVEFKQLAKEITHLLNKSAVKLNLHQEQSEPALPLLEPLNSFYNLEQYELWFRQQLSPMLSKVLEKTAEKDPMTSFVLDYLDHHLDQDITLDIMADKLNITPGYLSTYFKEKTGTNFSDYLNGLRMQRAKEQLHNLDLKIHEVAARVGYQNVNSFIRMFKRYSGMTPGEYRKKYGAS